MDGDEQHVCSSCLSSLPLTEHATHNDNKASGLFTDLKKVVKTAAYCFYDHESYFYQMIHALKYYNQPQVGVVLGRQMAEHFINEKPTWFEGIDLIIPVPLHKKRMAKRGYNQSEMIADGISQVTGIPIDTKHLLRAVNNPSQTQKNTEERKKNTEGIFELTNAQDLKGKHILLVDDIITTGATLHSCCTKLNSIRGLTISIITLGIAGQRHY